MKSICEAKVRLMRHEKLYYFTVVFPEFIRMTGSCHEIFKVWFLDYS